MKVIDWNIQNRNTGDWPARKLSHEVILRRERPDLLCVQEAWIEQVEFLGGVLVGHGRAGVGRDDGRADGEHCTIFYGRERFELLADGTFWLSDTPDRPGITWRADHNRICTWCRLRNRQGGGEFFVFNTHFPLFEEAREKSADLVVRRIEAIAGAAAVLLTGDFNCTPGSAPWSKITSTGLVSADSASQPTFHKDKGDIHLFAIRSPSAPAKEPAKRRMSPLSRCIDAILVSSHWRVDGFRLLTDAPDGLFPSDHFGLCAEVQLS